MDLKQNSRPVYVVDDDIGVRHAVTAVLEEAGFSVEAFDSAGALLKAPSPPPEACVLIDVFLPDLSGIDLQQALRERGCLAPIVMITGHGNVPIAVQAMKNGAVDFIEKPFAPETLVEVVLRARASQTSLGGEPALLLDRLARLTGRELAILQAAVAGQSAKETARALAISPRTVDVHRGHVLKKIGARNMTEAARMLLSCGAVASVITHSEQSEGAESP